MLSSSSEKHTNILLDTLPVFSTFPVDFFFYCFIALVPGEKKKWAPAGQRPPLSQTGDPVTGAISVVAAGRRAAATCLT